MATGESERVAALERLVRNLRAENEDLVKGAGGAGARGSMKQRGRTPLRRVNTAGQSPLVRTPSQRMETPVQVTVARTMAPATVDRLEKRCQTLDAQLCEMDAENEALLDQVDSLKAKVRAQETQIIELEEAEAEAADRASAAAAEKGRVKKEMDDVLTGIMASDKWRAPGAGPMCMCGLKDSQLKTLRASLAAAEKATREKSAALAASMAAHADTRVQLQSQRNCRLRAEAEAEEARCQMTVLQVESTGLRLQLDAADARALALISRAAAAEDRVLQLERQLASLPGGSAYLNTV